MEVRQKRGRFAKINDAYNAPNVAARINSRCKRPYGGRAGEARRCQRREMKTHARITGARYFAAGKNDRVKYIQRKKEREGETVECTKSPAEKSGENKSRGAKPTRRSVVIKLRALSKIETSSSGIGTAVRVVVVLVFYGFVGSTPRCKRSTAGLKKKQRRGLAAAVTGPKRICGFRKVDRETDREKERRKGGEREREPT